jgi:hypothetical protein
MNIERKYQVFISSTWSDLHAEREQVVRALLENECIPIGMELFPPSDETQWQYIKRMIDQCDYYLLILAGRYGTVEAESGISYTEKEYLYAESIAKPIIAFLRRDPETLPHNLVESNQTSQEKLAMFRNHVQKKMVKFYTDSLQIYPCVVQGINNLKKSRPDGGWVPAHMLPQQPVQKELEDLRIENANLKNRLLQAQEGRNCIHAIDVPKNFLDARGLMHDYISESLRTNDYITIRVMAVAAHYSWDFLEKNIPILLANAPSHKRLNLELEMVEPVHLEAFGLEDWRDKGKIICNRIIEFIRKTSEPGGVIHEGKLDISVYHYRNLPQWHGMLINSNYLFLGRTRWTLQPEKQIFDLSVGEQIYRLFASNDNFGGSDRIALFTCWFDYYKYAGLLFTSNITTSG